MSSMAFLKDAPLAKSSGRLFFVIAKTAVTHPGGLAYLPFCAIIFNSSDSTETELNGKKASQSKPERDLRATKQVPD